MNNLIDKFLDGELSEEEAVTLLDVIARDPDLERELRAHEEILAYATQETDGEPSPGFTDSVLGRIAAGSARPEPGSRPAVRHAWHRLWLPGLAGAAALALVFVLGRVSVPAPSPSNTGADNGAAVVSSSATGMENAALLERPRMVRLVYVPQTPDVSRVTVAGTFNGWDPDGLEMKRIGEVWTAQLSLPPGAYEYMFVENGDNWVTDPLAPSTRDDGFGRKNAVLDVSI